MMNKLILVWFFGLMLIISCSDPQPKDEVENNIIVEWADSKNSSDSIIVASKPLNNDSIINNIDVFTLNIDSLAKLIDYGYKLIQYKDGMLTDNEEDGIRRDFFDDTTRIASFEYTNDGNTYSYYINNKLVLVHKAEQNYYAQQFIHLKQMYDDFYESEAYNSTDVGHPLLHSKFYFQDGKLFEVKVKSDIGGISENYVSVNLKEVCKEDTLINNAFNIYKNCGVIPAKYYFNPDVLREE